MASLFLHRKYGRCYGIIDGQVVEKYIVQKPFDERKSDGMKSWFDPKYKHCLCKLHLFISWCFCYERLTMTKSYHCILLHIQIKKVFHTKKSNNNKNKRHYHSDIYISTRMLNVCYVSITTRILYIFSLVIVSNRNDNEFEITIT